MTSDTLKLGYQHEYNIVTIVNSVTQTPEIDTF